MPKAICNGGHWAYLAAHDTITLHTASSSGRPLSALWYNIHNEASSKCFMFICSWEAVNASLSSLEYTIVSHSEYISFLAIGCHVLHIAVIPYQHFFSFIPVI